MKSWPLCSKNGGFSALDEPCISQLTSVNFDKAPTVMNLFELIMKHYTLSSEFHSRGFSNLYINLV